MRISISQLHARTGYWIRRVEEVGEILVTDRGEVIAKIRPDKTSRKPVNEVPYFARRKMLPAFRKLYEAGKLGGGRDVTELISEDREDRDI